MRAGAFISICLLALVGLGTGACSSNGYGLAISTVERTPEADIVTIQAIGLSLDGGPLASAALGYRETRLFLNAGAITSHCDPVCRFRPPQFSQTPMAADRRSVGVTVHAAEQRAGLTIGVEQVLARFIPADAPSSCSSFHYSPEAIDLAVFQWVEAEECNEVF